MTVPLIAIIRNQSTCREVVVHVDKFEPRRHGLVKDYTGDMENMVQIFLNISHA